MNYSYIPQKVIERIPVYSNKTNCPHCGSDGTFYSLTNTYGAPLTCNKCKTTFNRKIIGYNQQIVEKYVQ